MEPTVRPRRSALYLPASNAKALAKARTLPVDVVILDLEDAVAPESKLEARAAAVAAMRDGGFGRSELAIRINGLDTEWGREDLAAAAEAGPDAILVPKVASAADIRACEGLMNSAPAATQLWAMIETCAAILDLDSIAATAGTTRLSLFVMGVNDLAKEMRARLAPGRVPFQPILTSAVLAARAHGVSILDGVCNEFRELDRFREETEQGLLFGFDGKTLIHPDQVAICNAVFSPSADELRWAGAIVDAFALPENAGKGAIRVEGRMVELLHLEQARRVQQMARLIEAQ
jgi:citrate lyase subunit beta/citryl-CoA lyase